MFRIMRHVLGVHPKILSFDDAPELSRIHEPDEGRSRVDLLVLAVDHDASEDPTVDPLLVKAGDLEQVHLGVEEFLGVAIEVLVPLVKRALRFVELRDAHHVHCSKIWF